jgi:ribosomal protein S7
MLVLNNYNNISKLLVNNKNIKNKLVEDLDHLLKINKPLLKKKKIKLSKVIEINFSTQFSKLIRRNKRFKRNVRVFRKRFFYGLTKLNKKFRRKFKKILESLEVYKKEFIEKLYYRVRYNLLFSRNFTYRFSIVWKQWKEWKRKNRMNLKKKNKKKRFYSNYFFFHRTIKRYNEILKIRIDNSYHFLNFSNFEENFFNRLYLRRNYFKFLKRSSKYSREAKKKIKELKKVNKLYSPVFIDKKNTKLIFKLGGYLNFFNDRLAFFKKRKKKRVFQVRYRPKKEKVKRISYLKGKKELLKSYIGYVNIILRKYVKTNKLPIFEDSIKDNINGITAKKKLDNINLLLKNQKILKIRMKKLAKKMRRKNIITRIIFSNIKMKSLDYPITIKDKVKLFYNYWNMNSLYLKFIGFILKNGKRSKAELILNKSLFLIKELILCNPLFFFTKSIYNSQSIFEFSKQKRQNRTLLIPRITPYKKRINLAIRTITKNIRNNEMLRRIKKLNKKNKVNTSYILYNILISHFFFKGEIKKELILNVKNAFKQKQFLRKGIKSNNFSFNRLLKYLSFKKLRGYHF